MSYRLEHYQRLMTKLKIMQEETQFSGVSVEEIKGPRRTREIVQVRDCVIRRLRDEMGLSLVAIGRILNRDHTTIVASLKRTKRSGDETGGLEGEAE